MRKIIAVLICFLFLGSFAESLKGGVSKDYIPKGFFGSWGVISQLKSSNNPDIFNFESRDVWVLSGYQNLSKANILILENLQSGAKSEITIKDKSVDGHTLKFTRQKETREKTGYAVYREIVEFTLLGNNFSGSDTFIVEHYNTEKKLIKKDEALYKVSGVKISGSTEIKD